MKCDEEYHYFQLHNTSYPVKFALNFKIVKDSLKIDTCENKTKEKVTNKIFD